MFNERFDKILKKNLEAVRPEFQPQAWERFSKRLPATGLLPFLGQYGGWVLSAMMLAGWGATIYTLHQNQELMRQFSDVKGKRVLIQSGSENEISNSHERRVVDTVYIVKKTIVEHRHYSLAEKKSDLETQQTRSLPQIPDAVVRPTASNWIGPSLSRDWTNAVSESDDNNQASGSETVMLGLQPFDSSQIAATSNTLMKMDSLNRTLDKEAVMALIDSAWAQQSVMYKAVASEVKNPVDGSLNSLEHFVRERSLRTPFRLSSLQPRLGIESSFSLYGYGLGPSFEIFPTENLGFSFGIHAATLKAENHKVLRDYNSATGKLFLVQYRNYLPARFDRIEDISIKTSVISIPINLKYYIPLSQNLSIFMHTGTSLDVSAYQQVSFQSYLNQSKRRNTFEMDVSPHFFNDFMIGAGIQYRKSRIHAQLAPFYVYDFRSIENTAHGSNFGVRGSLWLNLFK